MSDAEKLRLLADWFDKRDQLSVGDKQFQDEVQRDLRRIADRLDATQKPAAPPAGVRVLRVLEYAYDSPEAAEQDMQMWRGQGDPSWGGGRVRMRSAALPFEAIPWPNQEPARERVLMREVLKLTRAGVAEALDHLAEGRAEEARQTLVLHLGAPTRRAADESSAQGEGRG